MRSELQKFIRERLDRLPARPKPVKRPAPRRAPGPYVKTMKGKSLEERFWLKVKLPAVSGGCWLWAGSRYTWLVQGIKRNPVLWAFERFTGQQVPGSHHLKPRCGHADCINPFHMDMLERNLWARKLDAAQVQAIRQDPRSNTAIARDYGVGQPFVSMVKAGKRRAGSCPVEAGVRDKAA